ncbi:MAG: 16S rRNA (uracil(1498)-N(3))-methyltransferase [Eubacteriaceae bacterium]
MNRFFVIDEEISDGIVHLDGENHKHINKSLRMKTGEKIELSDGKCSEYIGEIIEINKTNVGVKILRQYQNKSEPTIEVSLYQGIPKGQKMDLIVQKAVELGVKNIHPIIMHRTVVEIEKKSNKKIERWQKISEEAAKQSKRGIIPKVNNVMHINDLPIEMKNNQLNIIAYEDEKKQKIKEVLANNLTPKKIGILIGPEGGITEKEHELITSIGGISISLGERILRTETAGISLVSMLMYHYEM